MDKMLKKLINQIYNYELYKYKKINPKFNNHYFIIIGEQTYNKLKQL